MRILALILLLSVLPLCGCSQPHQDPTTAQSTGGADGGGGDALLDSRLAPGELQLLRDEGKFLTRAILNFQATLNADDLNELTSKVNINLAHSDVVDLPIMESAFQRLFPSDHARTAFDELSEVNIEWRKSGACKDAHEVEKDGSAFNVNSAICISEDRIDAKSSKNTAGILGLSLMAHEITHRQGGNEPEAVAVQRIVGETLGSGNLKGLVEGLKSSAFRAKAKKTRASLEWLLQSDLSDKDMTCFKVRMLQDGVEAILGNELSLVGLRRYSPETRKTIPEILALSKGAVGYCDLSLDSQLGTYAGSQVAIEVDHLDSSNVSISPGDKPSLKSRIQSLSELLQKIFSDLEAIGVPTVRT